MCSWWKVQKNQNLLQGELKLLMTSQLEVTNASILMYAFTLFSLHDAKIIS